MIYPVITIRDNKTGYLPPQVEQSIEAAIRGFTFALNKPDTMMYEFAQDYDLFKVGEFDTDTGMIEPCTPVNLCSGYSVLKKAEEILRK